MAVASIQSSLLLFICPLETIQTQLHLCSRSELASGLTVTQSALLLLSQGPYFIQTARGTGCILMKQGRVRDNDRNRTRLILTPGNVFAWLLSRASSSSSSRCCAGFLILHGESERPGRLCPCAVVLSCSRSCAAGRNSAGLCTIAASPPRPVILSHRPPSAERDVLVGAIATFRLLAIINN